MTKNILTSLLIQKNKCIIDALKQLDKTAKGTLLIVDNDHHLLGTISDGDLRRSLIEGKQLSDTLEELYNKNPLYILENTPLKEIKDIFLSKHITLLPILNASKKIINITTWDEAFSSPFPTPTPVSHLNIPVVIMAGGKGTRMEPFTHVLPKPLIPIQNKTIMEHMIDIFNQQGASTFYATLNFKKTMIEAYFNGLENRDYDLNYIYEKHFYGTAGSLSNMPKLSSEFIVTNCDILVHTDYSKALDLHREKKASLTIISAVQHTKVPYGVIEQNKEGMVSGITEKPEYSFLVNSGIYILSPEAIDYIPKDTLFHMTDLIEALIKAGLHVLSYPVNASEFIDVGNWDAYQDSVRRLNELTRLV